MYEEEDEVGSGGAAAGAIWLSGVRSGGGARRSGEGGWIVSGEGTGRLDMAERGGAGGAGGV